MSCQGGTLALLTVQFGTAVHLAYLCAEVWCTAHCSFVFIFVYIYVVHSSELFEVRSTQCLAFRCTWNQHSAYRADSPLRPLTLITKWRALSVGVCRIETWIMGACTLSLLTERATVARIY